MGRCSEPKAGPQVAVDGGELFGVDEVVEGETEERPPGGGPCRFDPVTGEGVDELPV